MKASGEKLSTVDGEGDGRDGRECPGQGPVEEASEGNREGGSSGTLGQEGGFLYFIETASGGVVKMESNHRIRSVRHLRSAPPAQLKDYEDVRSSLFREHIAT